MYKSKIMCFSAEVFTFALLPDLLVDAGHATVKACAALWSVPDLAVGETLTFDPCR